ncbi:MAG: hypothetical protein HW403_706 [Dehalococcoidia bacterium]|nr:hypothetical protein [Dehalococcoidia bacterium]
MTHRKSIVKLWTSMALTLVVTLVSPIAAPAILRAATFGATTTAVASVPPNPRFGIAHIGYGSEAPVESRYQLAAKSGASWNRWALYWNEIESSSGAYNFTKQDATANADRAHGLNTLGILFGTPQWASTAPQSTSVASVSEVRVGRTSKPSGDFHTLLGPGDISTTIYPPKNLYQPVFSDGTNVPGPNKSINQDNYWARFVYTTVSHFKGQITHWEIWNEPDFSPSSQSNWFGFWNGSLEDYKQLLKVSYLAAKAADSNSVIVMGSMAYWFDTTFFPRLLDSLKQDRDASANNYYFHVTGWHWYSRARQLYDKTLWVKDLLNSHGMAGKKIWVTESSLPVCGDPVLGGKPACSPGSNRGTLENQASYTLQASAYALAAGVDLLFFFQLYDDAVGPFEYFGLVRNDGTLRPAFGAFQIAATYFRDAKLAYATPSRSGLVELVTLYTIDNRRVMVVWNNSGSPVSVDLPAQVAQGSSILQDTTTRSITASKERLYRLDLSPATLNNNPRRLPPDYLVGGPVIVVHEREVSSQNGTLKGVVKNPVGQPISGAKVDTGSPAAAADGLGRYSLSLLPGLYDVKVTAPNHLSPEPVRSLAVWGGSDTVLDFKLNFAHTRLLPIILNSGKRPWG